MSQITENQPSIVTRDDVRRIQGYAHLSDDEADEILLCIRQYVSLILHLHFQIKP